MDEEEVKAEQLNYSLLKWSSRLAEKALLRWGNITGENSAKDNQLISVNGFKDGFLFGKIVKFLIDPDFFLDINDDQVSEFNAPTSQSSALVEIKDNMIKYIQESNPMVWKKIGNPLYLRLPGGTIIKISSSTGTLTETTTEEDIFELIKLLLICTVCSPNRQTTLDDILKTLDEDSSKVHLLDFVEEIFGQEEEEKEDQKGEQRSASAAEAEVVQLKLLTPSPTPPIKGGKNRRRNRGKRGNTSQEVSAASKFANEETEILQENVKLGRKVIELSQENEHLSQSNDSLQRKLESCISEEFFMTKETEFKEKDRKVQQENYELKMMIDECEYKEKSLQEKLRNALQKSASNSEAKKALAIANDELSFLRESALKVENMETINKRLHDELADEKTAVKSHLARIEQLHQKNQLLENELTNLTKLRSSIDKLKFQLAENDRQQKEDSQRTEFIEQENRNLYDQLRSAQDKILKLQDEKIQLQRQLSETQTEQLNGAENGSKNHSFLEDVVGSSDDNEHVFENSLPLVYREKVEKLQSENQQLTNDLTAQREQLATVEGFKVLVQELETRQAELVGEICQKELEQIDMKAYYEEELNKLKATFGKSTIQNPRDPIRLYSTDKTEKRFQESPNSAPLEKPPGKRVLENLQSSGSSATKEFVFIPSINKFDAFEETGAENVPSLVPVLSRPLFSMSSRSLSTPIPVSPLPITMETEYSVVIDKEHYKEEIRNEVDKIRVAFEMEEKLLASVFYNYGLKLHRETVEERNSSVNYLQKLRNLAAPPPVKIAGPATSHSVSVPPPATPALTSPETNLPSQRRLGLGATVVGDRRTNPSSRTTTTNRISRVRYEIL